MTTWNGICATSTAVTTGFQMASIFIQVCILLAAFYAARRWRVMRPVVFAPALWAGYGVVYYSFVLAGRFSPDALLLWGAVHRLLAGVIFLIGLIVLILIMAAPGPVEWPDDNELE